MKHPSEATLELLCSALEAAHIELGAAEAILIAAHLDLLAEQNQVVNLTSVDSAEDAVVLHAVDSLLALPELHSAPAGPVLDIGSGGGFPGLPLAIATDRPCVLLDSVSKKSRAVQHMVTELGLDERVTCSSDRAEVFALERPEVFAVVTARAVAQLPTLVELAAPFLKTGGRLICLKGTPEEGELARGVTAASRVGMREVAVRPCELPGGRGARAIVSYEKVGRPSVTLPRRIGMAQHSPLA